MSSRTELRTSVLAALAPDASVVDELLSYDPDGFGAATPPQVRLPLEDEPFVDTWRRYAREVAERGMASLAQHLVQLQFPVEQGISETETYRAATRRGERRAGGGVLRLPLVDPGRCSVVIHPTWAGSIPIVQAGCRDDFVTLIRAFTRRNEPSPIPASMGGCMVAGYNNWDRFERLAARWKHEHPGETFTVGCVAGEREEYQDRFIVLAPGWYSHVPPERLGLTDDEWRERSMTIRREHECAHYCTRRLFSSMRNSLLDEIVADACGIATAAGRFRADWLLAFLGLDRFPECRPDGRIHNYRGTPPLSDTAFQLLQQLVVAAAVNFEVFTRLHRDDFEGPLRTLLVLLTLAPMTVESLASEAAPALLAESLSLARVHAAHATAPGTPVQSDFMEDVQ